VSPGKQELAMMEYSKPQDLPDGTNQEPPRLPFVVGIGASAGGLEALEQLFSEMPLKTGLPYIVVQHLSPDFKSVMDDLLARITDIPIRMIENEMLLEADTIYLMPPRKEVIYSAGRLLLTDRSRGGEFSFPIDQFFRSLAADAGDRAIAVVLSGSGTDGSRGICHVHESGGLVVAQKPVSAKFNGMPKAAQDTGIVDMLLEPAEIGQALVNYSRTLAKQGPRATDSAVLERPMHTVFHLLKKHCGVDFADYKTTTIGRRVQRRLMLAGLQNLDDYVSVLKENPEEVDRLYKDLLIGVTTFFRDPEVFERLEKDVLPNLMQRLPPEQEFRAWTVGTATGEEAYSLAILVRESLDQLQVDRPVKIFATDVHRDSLETASRGIYSPEQLSGVSQDRLERFFIRRGEDFHVSPEIRKMVVCVGHNMVHDAPFTKLDLITCRNVLIYLAAPAQKKVLSLFHFALNREGVLCLGPSETLGELDVEFATMDERAKIFRKQRDLLLPAATRMPMSVTFPTPTVAQRPQRIQPDILSAYDVLLSELMPAGVLINRNHELIHTFTGGSKFLAYPEGRASLDVLELVHSDIRSTLSAALRRVTQEMQPVVFEGLRCDLGGGPLELKLTVRPLSSKDADDAETRLLVLFDTQVEETQSPMEAPASFRAHEISNKEIESLERDLQLARGNLQATVEQFQMTNEELQATNEQLISSNEELQSTNEELHSVNEELYTVNAEHQRKISELTELTADMDNLLGSTNVHTIFLDLQMRIRRFTPGIADTFNFIPQDVGRRIDTFTYNILDKDLVLEIKHVLETETPFEKEVRDRNERWYLLRILPYMVSGHVDGAVLTLIDVTSLKAAEKKLAEMSEIVEHSDDAIMRITTDGVITTWNPGAEKLFGFTASEVMGKDVSLLIPEGLCDQAQDELYESVNSGSVAHYESKRCCRNGRTIDVALTLSPIRNEDGQVVGASEIVRDITAQKLAEKEVLAAVRHRDHFLAMLSHELRNPLAAVLNATALLQTGDLDASTDEEARSMVNSNVQHVAHLLDDLLDLSRFTYDKINLKKKTLDLTHLAEDAVRSVQALVQSKHHELIVNIPDTPIYVEADYNRIRQAQVNLLINAAKYTSAGGRIEYTVERQSDEAVIIVSDNGIGISDALLQNIFEPFVQSEQSLDRSKGGMGLGLPLVRMITEAHGGSISACSEGEACGSKFTLRLPITSNQPIDEPSSPPTTAASGRKLLIVEDNHGIQKMLARLMELKGFQVETAGNGKAGWEAFSGFKPDLALIDIGLPDVNGYELAKLIRDAEKSDDNVSQCFLVAVTGYGQESDRRMATSAGFDLHLVKPITPDDLFAALDDTLPPTN